MPDVEGVIARAARRGAGFGCPACGTELSGLNRSVSELGLCASCGRLYATEGRQADALVGQRFHVRVEAPGIRPSADRPGEVDPSTVRWSWHRAGVCPWGVCP